jgi:hypothetical protein
MTEVTLIPASDQVQLMLDSPMTDGEQQQLAAIEARATSSAGKITINKIEMAQCLLEVYNDKLFRGKTGGRTWGDYLQSHDFSKLGFPNALTTETATNHLNYAALCDAIDDWNDSNPGRELPYPAGSTHLQGWTLLFDRKKASSGVSSVSAYMPITGAENALKTWYTAVVNNDGKAPDCNTARSYGRKARDSGLGRTAFASEGNSATLTRPTSRGSGPQPEPESVQRTVSAETRMEAAAAQLERDQHRAADRSLRADGIDPRSISTMEKESDFDVMNECETYSTQMNKVYLNIQTLDVWVRGRLNQYGTDGMEMLRKFDAGMYSIHDDIGNITDMSQRLADLAALLQDYIEPGSLDENSFTPEPKA